MAQIPRLYRDSTDRQSSSPSAALGAFSDPPSAPVPTSSAPIPDFQASSNSTEIPLPSMEEGGEEEDMDLDDDTSMISRVPLQAQTLLLILTRRTPHSSLLLFLSLPPLH